MSNTSWGRFAKWYDTLLEGEGDTYQSKVILPNVLRLVSPKKGQMVLDLACGQGFFTRELSKNGVNAIGVDVAPELVALAKKNSNKDIRYEVAPAHQVSFLEDSSIDVIISILALQNIENIGHVFKECARLMKTGGLFLFAINHPAFRIPKESYWIWDERMMIQYRRIDRYLSESKVDIQMHPGSAPDEHTLTFHRPLQYYFKALRKAGFVVTIFEEWNSHKASGKGPRKAAEDRARKEIPLFLCMGARKQS